MNFLRGNSNVSRIIKNTGANVFIKGLYGLTRIILLLLIARKFGPENFGSLSLVISVVEIFRVLTDFGVDIVTIRRFSRNRLLSNRLMGNALSLKLVSATAGYLIAGLFFWMSFKSTQGMVLLLIMGTTLYSTHLINAFASYFQANLKMQNIIVSSVISSIFYVSFTIFGLYKDWSIAALVLVMPVSELLNLFLVAKIYNQIAPLRFGFNRRIILSLIKESIPVGVAGIVVIIYLRMDALLIAWFIGEKGVGEYAAAFRLTEPFMLIFTSLSLSLYALFLETKEGRAANTRKNILKVLGVVLSLGLISAIMLSSFSSKIMGRFFHEYSASANVLMVLSWLIVFKAINVQLTAFINSRGKYSYITVIAVINLMVNITLNLILIQRYGILGVAFAVIGTEALNTLMQSACVIRLFDFSPRGSS